MFYKDFAVTSSGSFLNGVHKKIYTPPNGWFGPNNQFIGFASLEVGLKKDEVYTVLAEIIQGDKQFTVSMDFGRLILQIINSLPLRFY